MKLLIPGLLLVAAIAAVAWVLVPSGTPESTADARRTPASATGGAANTTHDPDDDGHDDRQAKRPQATPGTGKGAAALAAARAQAARSAAAAENGGATGAAVNGNGLGAIAPAGIEPDEVLDRGDKPSKWGRQGREAGRAEPKQVKDALRAYYNNLPKSGLIPATVKLEEIFPLAVIDEMNLPPGGRVIELGHYPIGDRQAFDHVLLQPDGNQGALGLTVITPDGERVREYVFFESPTETELTPANP